MTKTCRQCGETVKRAGLCAHCRSERRRKQWRNASSKYAAKKEISVPMYKVVEDALAAGHEVKLILPPPLFGMKTPRGPDEGMSTRNRALQAVLDHNSHESSNHPWWEAHPDAFYGI